MKKVFKVIGIRLILLHFIIANMILQKNRDRPRLLTTIMAVGSLALCFDFNCETGLEVDGEVILWDDYNKITV